MAVLLGEHAAAGGPGIEPRWTRSDKDGVGTAYSVSSQVWFTVTKGSLHEVYYPTIDHPQVRDLQYLMTDGETCFGDERHLDNTHACLAPYPLGYRITKTDPQQRYRLSKEGIAAPHQACVLVQTRLEAGAAVRAKLRLFALLAPHLEVGGRHHDGNVVRTNWGNVLTAHKGSAWVGLVASVPCVRCACGYVGTTDGWQDLVRDFRMDWECDCAPDGTIALTGALDGQRAPEFVLALAFGDCLHQALMAASQALGLPFAAHRTRFIQQWQRARGHLVAHNEGVTGDAGQLYRGSHGLLLAHADKRYDGAMIASLSLPWGAYMGEDDLGGYPLVWTRDMCQAASGLRAAGHTAVPLRALMSLAGTQRPDGGCSPNFWSDGEPYWRGYQLGETAFPMLLAWHLRRAQALEDCDPSPMVRKAASYLLVTGPVTAQERWEENSGDAPSTLAVHIAALVCAAAFARERGELATAQSLEEYADCLEAPLEPWTVTTEGVLVPGMRRHVIRIHPVDVHDPDLDADANHGLLERRTQPPGAVTVYPAKDIVEAGFLELVRYGVRRPGDPVLEEALRVVDVVLKVDTPAGPCWRRYHHDGSGQRPDGGPYLGWGKEHAWPLLTANAATTSWRQGGTCGRTSGPWSGSPRPWACSRNRSGQTRTGPTRTCIAAARLAARGPWSGRMRSP